MSNWIQDRYASKRGLVNTWSHRLRASLGMYSDMNISDWNAYDRIVFVCKGNICRSAFAEAVYHGLGKQAASCGIDTVEGSPANADALRIAATLGVDLQAHRTHRIQQMALREGDLLVAMEPSQIESMRSQGIDAPATLLGMRGEPRLPHIVDPYGSNDEYFTRCLTYIRNTLDAVARQK